jgi:hypothetical protein
MPRDNFRTGGLTCAYMSSSPYYHYWHCSVDLTVRACPGVYGFPAELVITYGKYVPEWESNARGGEKLAQQFATATIDGVSVKVTMNSIWEDTKRYEWKNYYPIPTGTYTIKVPEAPHDAGPTGFYQAFDKRLQHHGDVPLVVEG